MSREDRIERLRLPSGGAEERLDKRLATGFPELSRSKLQLWIREGRVRVDGAVCTKPGQAVAGGAELELRRPAEPTLAELVAGWEGLEPLHVDEHLLVYDKPAGLLVHPGDGGGEATLAQLADLRHGPLPCAEQADRPGIVHRLDRQTSGVIVLARSLPALHELQRQFREREVEKTYRALVHGRPRFESEWIESAIGHDPKQADRFHVVPSGRGRAASTYYEVAERFRDYAWLRVRPRTGRTHQIRVHLTSVGLPIVADAVYRRDRPAAEELPPEAPPLCRQALHAEELVLRHPASGERLAFRAPLPADIGAVLAWLRTHRPAG